MNFRNIIIALFMAFLNMISVYAASEATTEFSITLPEYINIQTLTSPVLTAHITDKTGNLHAPLFSKFRVISNSSETKTLYLKSEAVTESGSEDSMFAMGSNVYVAFTHVNKKPTSEALSNCKMGSSPKYSAGVVAYPITSIIGAKSEYSGSINRYQIFVNNGITDITVNLGSNVLRSSFGKNDPSGFYQATISLTESEI